MNASSSLTRLMEDVPPLDAIGAPAARTYTFEDGPPPTLHGKVGFRAFPDTLDGLDMPRCSNGHHIFAQADKPASSARAKVRTDRASDSCPGPQSDVDEWSTETAAQVALDDPSQQIPPPPPPLIRFAHLQSLQDVQDLIPLLQKAIKAEKDQSMEGARDSREASYLGWQLCLLKQQKSVLMRLNAQDYRPKSSRVRDLLQYKVQKAFPFKLPVYVQLKYTDTPLPVEQLLQDLHTAFDLSANEGLGKAIEWLRHQIDELKASPLHWQPKQKKQAKGSVFLQQTFALLDALSDRKTAILRRAPHPAPSSGMPKSGAHDTHAASTSYPAGPSTPLRHILASPSYSPFSEIESHEDTGGLIVEAAEFDHELFRDIFGTPQGDGRRIMSSPSPSTINFAEAHPEASSSFGRKTHSQLQSGEESLFQDAGSIFKPEFSPLLDLGETKSPPAAATGDTHSGGSAPLKEDANRSRKGKGGDTVEEVDVNDDGLEEGEILDACETGPVTVGDLQARVTCSQRSASWIDEADVEANFESERLSSMHEAQISASSRTSSYQTK